MVAREAAARAGQTAAKQVATLETAAAPLVAVETGAAVVVGVNRFTADDDPEPELLRVDPSIEQEQVARLQDFMNRRDGQGAQQALMRLKSAAEGSGNLMPYILDSVENEASLGEIADSLRSVFGLYRERVVI